MKWVHKTSPKIVVGNMWLVAVATGGCGNIPVFGGNVQQFNGPIMPDVGYRAGQFGYQPHVAGYPHPGVPPPPDTRDGSQYVIPGSANHFAPADGGGGPQFTASGPAVYSGTHPSSLQTATPQNNVSNISTPSFPSKTPTSVPPEVPDSKPKQEDRTFPPKSSNEAPTPDGRPLPPNITEAPSTGYSSVLSNGSVEQLPKKDSLPEVEHQSGEVTMGSSGGSGSTENSVRTSVYPVSVAYPSTASNIDGIRGRSSDVVAMEGMSSRYGVGPDGMMDGRYPANGRDGYVGRMGHPVAVDGTFRHSYQRQMESYDRPLFGSQTGMQPHFQHPGYFSHPTHPSYQFHPHSHSSHGPSYHSPVGTTPGEVGPDRIGELYGGMGRPPFPGLMTPPGSANSSTSHPSNDCDSERALANGEADAARRTDIQTKTSENAFAESTFTNRVR